MFECHDLSQDVLVNETLSWNTLQWLSLGQGLRLGLGSIGHASVVMMHLINWYSSKYSSNRVVRQWVVGRLVGICLDKKNHEISTFNLYYSLNSLQQNTLEHFCGVF